MKRINYQRRIARFKSERGIALLIVLSATLALMILVVEFVYTTRIHYTMAQNLRDRLQAEYLAKSGVQMAMLLLKIQKKLDNVKVDHATLLSAGPLYKQIPIDTNLLHLALSAGQVEGLNLKLNDQDRKNLEAFLDFAGNFQAEINDEDGKINLNALRTKTLQAAQGSGAVPQSPTPSPSPAANHSGSGSSEGPPTVSEITVEQLQSLFDLQNYKRLFSTTSQRDELIYNIMDWVDDDTDRSGFGGGSEDTLYSGSGAGLASPRGAKNAKLDSLEEIGLIHGVNQEILDTFRDSLTVYGTGNQINVNTASNQLLYGLVGSLISSRNKAEIDKIVDWVDENRNFTDQNEFLTGLKNRFGYDKNELDAFTLNTLKFKSTTFTISATGTVGDEVSYSDPVRVKIKVVLSFPAPTVATANVAAAAQQTTTRYALPGGIKVSYWRVE